MDNPSSILKIVGQVAGIGGIALGVFLLIFREVIRKNIFPNLAQIQAYRIIRLIVILTFFIAALGIGSWTYVQKSHGGPTPSPTFPSQSAEPAMLKHMELVDSNRFLDAWKSMSTEAHKRFQYEFIAKAYETQRTPLGKVLQRTLHGVTTFKQLPDQTPGAFTSATYISNFENGGLYLEAITTIGEEGDWRVLFHQLAPCPAAICKG